MSEKSLSKQQKYQLVQEDYDGTVAFYDQRYNAAEEFRKQMEDFLLSLAKNAVVLDCGSGPGKEAGIIAKAALRVVALDLSANMLMKVRENHPHLETVEANMNALPFPDNSFDALWCSRAIIHIPQEDLVQTISEFYRVLKSDGVLGLIFRIPDEDILLKEEFLPEDAPNSEGLIYYRNLYSEGYMSDILTRVGFALEQKEPGVSIDKEVSLYIRARKRNTNAVRRDG